MTREEIVLAMEACQSPTSIYDLLSIRNGTSSN